jgi:hypothetical protein
VIDKEEERRIRKAGEEEERQANASLDGCSLASVPAFLIVPLRPSCRKRSSAGVQ